MALPVHLYYNGELWGIIEIFRKGCGIVLSMLLSALEGGEGRGRLRWIYDQYHARMERVAMGILQEQSDAEDAVQKFPVTGCPSGSSL